ncbi:MAG: hypothetical protein LKF31_07340 [Muribaculaceae bacterium]|jgi:hypothetical protein|nr:hypothetical protein [Muribaculaceae bacterium]
MSESKSTIPAPKATAKALDKLLDKMYISNVSKRLRELNQPNDIDRKRWIWELIQNAKDTIANDKNRNTIKIKISIDGDCVKFQHNGNPFTADARLGLLYKYSEDKENDESTGRFGTGFLTTHCLSKIVSIESNIYGDNDTINGFSVTMYRDGFTEQELLDGLEKMRKSEFYYDKPFEWTTYTYHVNSDSGRLAIQLGKENFKDNISQTFLFCKELSSVELIDNGELTTIERVEEGVLSDDVRIAKFKINVDDKSSVRTFIYCSSKSEDAELSEKYKTQRSIRIKAACEINDNNNIISTGQSTSLFCVFPLVGIESQIQMPIFIDSPDFEPDSERQSLILNGLTKDEEKGTITEVGINQKILEKVPAMFEMLINYLSKNAFNNFFNLANGLKSTKDHDKLDKKWYYDKIISSLKGILIESPIVQPYISMPGESLRKLSECIIIKEKSKEAENKLFSILSYLYPEQLVTNNTEWSQMLWKDDSIKLWDTTEVCKDIESKGSIDSINIVPNPQTKDNIDLYTWYNNLLEFILSQNELLLKDYSLLPNMNGKFLKRDEKDFKQGEGVSDGILNMLAEIGEDMRPFLLHRRITSVKLENEFNSNSYSAKANSLAKAIIDESTTQSSDMEKLNRLKPLFSIIISDSTKYEQDFIIKRNRIFTIIKELFELTDLNSTVENSMTKYAWEATDQWLINLFIKTLESKKSLSALPTGLNAKWLNDAIFSLEITLSKMNEAAILPNQNGNFCKSKELFIDNGIPDILKDDVFNNVGLYYKDSLLDNSINAKAMGITNSKNISDFADDLEEKTDGKDSRIYQYNVYSYGYYRNYSDDSIRQVARYLIQILPNSESDGTQETQTALRDIARFFLGESCTKNDNVIEFTDKKLWHRINWFICWDIIVLLKNNPNLEQLVEKLETDEETLLINLNVLYKYLEKRHCKLIEEQIYPNQKGNIVKRKYLYKESENIDKQLKDIIELVSDKDDENYYNILIDNRCSATLSEQKTLTDAYVYIDGKIKDLYENPKNWELNSFKKAAKLLIEDWGEDHKDLFDANHFPKVYPIKDSISMNVVWTIAERHQLQNLKNNLTTEQLLGLADHIDDIKDLSAKNKELQEENEKLKERIKALTEGKAVDFSEAGNDNASKRQQFEAQLEAQKKLMEVRPDWKFPDNYGECDENGKPYNFSAVTVTGETGKEISLVLKSYKSHNAKFKINPEEWEWIVKKEAKLLVYTKIHEEFDIVEVPQGDLVMNQSNISISFNSENLDNKKFSEKVSQFAEILHYFTDLHFDFNGFHISGNARRAIDIHAKQSGIQGETTDNDI